MIDDVPSLFEVPQSARRWAPKRTPRFVPAGYIEWTKYRPKAPHKCDDCKAFLAENDGQGPPSRDAKWLRKTTNSARYLCVTHANVWRHQDRLPKVDG